MYQSSLANLAVDAAVEIDNYILGKNDDFSNVEQFSGIIRKYQKEVLGNNDFPYLALCTAMEADYQKPISSVSRLTLEMNLLYLELSDVRRLPLERLKNLRNFLTRASKHFGAEEQRLERRMLRAFI